MSHSVFSPSAAHRILKCPPSLRLNAQLPDETSSYAEEGTCAHELCAYLVEKALGRDVKDPTPDLSYYNPEMQTCAEEYRDYVLSEYEQIKLDCPDAQLLVEVKVSIDRWVPEGYGTADCVIVADGLSEIIDFKYGTGVPVSAETEDFGGNPQLMCYALGVIAGFGALFDMQRIKTAIFQPRLENVSEHEFETASLLQWADEVLKPTAVVSLAGEGEFCAGDHCRFCKVKATCRKRAEYNLKLAQYDFRMPALLEDFEIEAIVTDVDRLVKWAEEIKKYALDEAIKGKQYETLKLVEGRSNRKYTSDADVAAVVTEAGFNAYKAPEVLGITEMTKQLGKKKFEELLGKLT